ncbi:YcgJ family protein, partial [Serratia marcescens]
MLLFIFAGGAPILAGAAEHHSLSTPASGVVCDNYFCADAAGISD